MVNAVACPAGRITAVGGKAPGRAHSATLRLSESSKVGHILCKSICVPRHLVALIIVNTLTKLLRQQLEMLLTHVHYVVNLVRYVKRYAVNIYDNSGFFCAVIVLVVWCAYLYMYAAKLCDITYHSLLETDCFLDNLISRPS